MIKMFLYYDTFQRKIYFQLLIAVTDLLIFCILRDCSDYIVIHPCGNYRDW